MARPISSMSKMALQDAIERTHPANDPLLEPQLFAAFPKPMQKAHADANAALEEGSVEPGEEVGGHAKDFRGLPLAARQQEDDRAAYISDLLDTLAMAATEPAQRTAQHYSQCITRSRLTTRQLANYLREYGRARPELHGSSIQHAMNNYLNALCGQPAG